VMASYARAAERAFRHEVARRESISRRERIRLIRSARSWFRNERAWSYRTSQPQSAAIDGRNPDLRPYVELREELLAIWERSNLSREQLLLQLQDWCRRAELSGSKAIQAFSLRLRQYT
jgi:stearoyl-CoA desaturase (delta-9 desaturase)